MFEEALVFTGHDGLLHGFGDFLQRHDLAVLRIEFRESGLAVVEIHRRALRKRGHIEIDAFDRKGRNDGFGRVIGANTAGIKKILVTTPPPTHNVMYAITNASTR